MLSNILLVNIYVDTSITKLSLIYISVLYWLAKLETGISKRNTDKTCKTLSVYCTQTKDNNINKKTKYYKNNFGKINIRI